MLRDDTGFVPLSDAWIINVANEIHRAMPDNAEEVDEMLQIARAVEQAVYERAAQECEKRAGPIETYNRDYPHYLECAAAIRTLATRESK